MDNSQNNNLNNNIPNPSINQNTNTASDLNTNGMQNTVQDDYYNNNSYYNNSNYESNYSDTSYEEKKPKNNTWLKILIAILVILIIIILLLKFCVGKGKSSDEKYTELKARICTAAETYVMNNPDVLDRTSPGKVATIKYKKLSDANLIEAQISNPYYKGGLFSKSKEDKYYSLDNTVRLTVASDLTLTCELVDNSQDVTAPVLRLNGDAEVTFAIGTEFQDPMASATDDYDGDLSDKIVRSGNVDLTKAGTYTLTYTVADSAGNTSSIKRTIIYEEYPNLEVTLGSILDGVTPMISLKGSNPYCMVKGTKYVEPGATATDNVDGNITDKIAVTNKITGNLIGSFRVTYKVEDSSGNQAVAYRAVIVSTECSKTGDNSTTANNAPVITLVGKNSVTINVGTEYIDLGATAYDKEDGDITSRITTDSTQVNVNKPGVYKVIYRVTDSEGKTTNAERTVTVKSPVSGTPSVRFTESKENITVMVGEGSDTLLVPPRAANENGTAVNVTKYMEDYFTKASVFAIDWNKEGKYRVIYTAIHSNGQVSQTKSIIVTIFSDGVTIGGKDAINVNVRTDNCDINEADLIAGGVTFTTKSTNTPIIKIESNEGKACKIGTYEVNVTATSAGGEPTTKKITVYVINGKPEVIDKNAPTKVVITKHTGNTTDPYNITGLWVGGAATGIAIDFTSTPPTGKTILKYQWSADCSKVDGELGTTSATTGSMTWIGTGKNAVCIRAVSSDGLYSPWSNPVNLYIDQTGPKINFTHTWADDKDDWHNTSMLTVSYVGTDLDSGLDHYEYTYDDVKAKKTDEIISIVDRSGNLIVGENAEPTRPELFIFVRAVDKAGNVGEWVTNPAYVNIDTIKPNTPTVTYVSGTENTAMPKLTITATDNINTKTNRYSGIKEISITLVDLSNNVILPIDGIFLADTDIKSNSATGTYSLPTHFGADRNYNVKVRAIDKAGNKSENAAEMTILVKGGVATDDISVKCPSGTKGGSGDVTVTTTPTTSSEREFTYVSSNTGVASVNENGRVTYVAAGTSTITVKLEGSKGTFEKTCTVTVSNPPVVSALSDGGGGDGGGTKVCYCTRDKTGEVSSVTISSTQTCNNSVCPTSSIADFYVAESKPPCAKPNCNTCNSNNAYNCKTCAYGYHLSGNSCVKNEPVVTITTMGTDNYNQTQNPNWCFLKETKVLTDNGYKNIEQVKVGEKVLSYNELTGKNEYSSVLRTFIHRNIKDTLYTISMGDKIVESTSYHPFYVKTNDGYKWVNASNLKLGDKLMDSDGNYHPITNLKFESIVKDVYNIEVENDHNYYVTENNILVHNKY